MCLLVAALVRPSPVLLLDEPFAGIAAPAIERLIEILPREAKRRLIIVVDHESDRLFGTADRLLGLRAGELLLDSTPEAVDDRRIAHVYGG